MDLLPEIALPPRILSNYVAALSHNNIKQDLDKFLQTRHQPANFLTELPAKLRLSAQEVRACDFLTLASLGCAPSRRSIDRCTVHTRALCAWGCLRVCGVMRFVPEASFAVQRSLLSCCRSG